MDIIEMTHCILHSQSMKLHFLRETMFYVAFIMKRTYTHVVFNMMPYENFDFWICTWVHSPHGRSDISLVHYTLNQTMVGYSESFMGYVFTTPPLNV